MCLTMQDPPSNMTMSNKDRLRPDADIYTLVCTLTDVWLYAILSLSFPVLYDIEIFPECNKRTAISSLIASFDTHTHTHTHKHTHTHTYPRYMTQIAQHAQGKHDQGV